MTQLPVGRSGLVVVSLCVLVLGSLGCEHQSLMEAGSLEPKLSSIQTQIFDQRCALSGCHVGSSAPFGLDLSQGVASGNLVNVPSGEVPQLDRVEPGDPDRSYLIMKLDGTPGIVGQRMPLGASALSSDEIQAIRDWITSGALDN